MGSFWPHQAYLKLLHQVSDDYSEDDEVEQHHDPDLSPTEIVLRREARRPTPYHFQSSAALQGLRVVRLRKAACTGEVAAALRDG
jgi:hypothetical protein